MGSQKKGVLVVINIDRNFRYVESDGVNNPSHYNYGDIEVIDVIDDWQLSFSLGNAIKYIGRCNHKDNKKADLEKAIWYLRHELKKVE